MHEASIGRDWPVWGGGREEQQRTAGACVRMRRYGREVSQALACPE